MIDLDHHVVSIELLEENFQAARKTLLDWLDYRRVYVPGSMWGEVRDEFAAVTAEEVAEHYELGLDGNADEQEQLIRAAHLLMVARDFGEMPLARLEMLAKLKFGGV